MATTNEFPSGLKKASEPLTHLFMCKKFASLQSSFAPFDSFHKAVFFLKVTRNDILHNLVRVAALLGRSMCELGLHVRVKVYFHVFNDTEKHGCRQILFARCAIQKVYPL